MQNTSETLIVLTTGKQDRGARATLALSWACSALAMGKRTSLFMTMDGTVWAMKNAMDGVQVEGFEPLKNYIETFFALDGKLLVCAPCTEYYCSIAGDGGSGALIEGAELAGLATVVSVAGQDCTVVTL